MYSTAQKIEMTDEEKLANILRSIEQLQHQAEILRKDIVKNNQRSAEKGA